MKSVIDRLAAGISEKVYPCAELLVAKEGKILLNEHVGSLYQKSPTLFDLASLTKPLCTAFLSMIFCEEKKLNLNNVVTEYFLTTQLKETNIKQLLNHTSGLIDWFPFHRDLFEHHAEDINYNRDFILNKVLNNNQLFNQRSSYVYSDLGYILLGAVLEQIEVERLDQIFRHKISQPLGIDDKIFFLPNGEEINYNTEHYIPTEYCPVRMRYIQAEVMDRNAFLLGGVAGHAGLFSNATTIHKLLSELRKASLDEKALITKSTFQTFCVPDQERPDDQPYFTLGFDSPTKGKSQSGTLMSKNSIGHLGYSGTSFWWDLDNDYWIIFLSNRCMPNRKNFKIKEFRPSFHDVIVKDMELNK